MSKYLDEKKNDLITRAEEVLDLAKTENRELSPEEVAEIESIKADIDMIKKTIGLEEELEQIKEMELEEDKTPEEEETKVEENRELMERRAFEDYIRGNVRDAEDVNMTKGDNGAIIPTSIANMIIKKVYDICPVLDRSQKFNVKGTLAVPYYPADASTDITCGYQTEFVQMVSTSGSFASVNLTGFLAGALTKVSRSLINNAQFDVVDFVVEHMAQSIARWVEKELLCGTASKIDGLSKLTNGVACASASVITADEVIAVHDKVKDVYQSNAMWIMSPATRTIIRTLKDGAGHYLLADDYSSPFGANLLGKPVYVSDNMPEVGDGAPVLFYGDFKGLATKFSEDINVQVLRERYADEHAIGVIGWLELDAKVINEQMIAKLVMSGTSL